MTVQNEPNTGFIGGWPWNTMGFTPEMERDFIKTDLGPTLEKGGWGPDKFNIMILDHNRDALPLWADVIFGDSEAAKYAKGIAVHWYSNWNPAAGPERLDQTHDKYPDHFILASEPCEIPLIDAGSHLSMGFWHYSEAYAHDIIKDLNHWTQGWNGWNMVLDTTGGPNWARQGSIYSAQIVVDESTKKYYKTPIYYAIGHFSKFLPPGSVRIATSPEIVDNKNVSNDAGLQATAFKRPDGGIVFIVINTMTQDQPFVIHDADLGQFTMKVTPNSFNTWLYYP